MKGFWKDVDASQTCLSIRKWTSSRLHLGLQYLYSLGNNDHPLIVKEIAHI